MSSAPVTMHVLVADDFEGMADTLATLIAAASSMVITTDVAHDGSEAVRLATAHPPQVAILDIDMPIMSGIDSAKAIRIRFGEASPLLIALTGRPDHLGSKRASVFDVGLTKPVDLERLLDHLTNDSSGPLKPGFD